MMNIFTNKDIKRFFIAICCSMVLFICFLQFLLLSLFHTYSGIILITTLMFFLAILYLCLLYFIKQQRKIESAEQHINDFLSGNVDSRINSNEEGSLCKLFHAINTLAVSLNAHIENEKKYKEFLKNTISDISHQLKTPLSALYIYNEIIQSEIAQSENIDETTLKKCICKSENELDRIQTLVQNLLKITKLDAGAITLILEKEKISSLMQNVMESFEVRAALEHKVIQIKGSEQTTLHCDRNWMQEAISNLIKNALDHTGAGGKIIIGWQVMPSLTRITVEDNGVGIPPEDIHHIFKRFYRSKSSKDKQGLGLGLPLAKSIVENHGGIMGVESDKGNGSIFTMDFTNLTNL